MFNVIFDKQGEGVFTIGISPIWIHRHSGGKRHFHFLVELGFWFLEIQIGRDEPKE